MANYDIKISLKKLGIALLVGGIPTIIAFVAQLPPEAVGGAAVITVINSILAAALNWVKHRKD